MSQNRERVIPWACIVPLAMAVGLTACGGGGGGSSSSGTTDTSNRSFTVPAEISAVPASDSGSSSPTAPRSFGAAIRTLARSATAGGLPATSDYVLTKGKTYVEERTLEQFEIIEQVFKALGQTGYADQVGNGPYKAVVAWEEQSDGKDIKQLQTWIVRADLTSGTFPDSTTGQYLRLRAWIPETDPGDGSKSWIKAQFNIYEDVTQSDTGVYTDFGVWDMNVLFNASETSVDTTSSDGYFAAQARKSGTTGSSLKIHEVFSAREFGLGGETKAILIRDGETGYGQVQFPDFDACWTEFQNDGGTDPNSFNCTNLPTKTAQYAYTPRDLVVSADGGTTKTYKDRQLNGAIKMVHRYGLFFADAGTVNNQTVAEGENVEKKFSFGFPVTYSAQGTGVGAGTYNAFAYYGAWQGRHSIWGPGGFTAVGGGTPTEFTRADLAPGQTATTYQVKEFSGTFTKRGLVDASLLDIKNVPSQTFVNKHYDLLYNAGAWRYCTGWIDWTDPNNLVCKGLGGNADIGFTDFTSQLSSLVVGTNDQRWVNINYESAPQTIEQYMRLESDPNITNFTFAGAGFYKASFGQNGLAPVTPAVKLSEANGKRLFVDIGGSIFVEYVGITNSTPTGWVQKTLSGFNPQTNHPQFSGSANFSPERGAEYYINANGSNFIVKRHSAADSVSSYDVKLELQTAANPANTNSGSSLSILPTGTDYLAFPWDRSVRFSFVQDPNSANYLVLTVKADDSGTLAANAVVDDSKWGLVAYNSSDQMLDASGSVVTVDEYGFPTSSTRPAEFMWEKPRTGENWGKQQFLCSANCTQYVVLSDPIFLNGVGVTDSIGNVVYVKDANGFDTTTPKTFNLQFDGWLHGLPDMYRELEKNGWTMTPDIAGKVWHVPAGTKVTDANSVNYFIKPLDTSLFLGVISEGSITGNGRTLPSLADVSTNAALSSVPGYTSHQMGAVPTTDDNGAALATKYSEGKLITSN